ncbi:MAG: PAS domain-containing protein, partial [Ekhidna sp.]
VHPEDAFMVIQTLEKLKKKKRIKPKPFRIKDAKGKYHWIESIFTNMLDDEQVAGVVINSRDVSAMVEKTNELLVSNERYELASKASGDHIYEWNLQTGETFRIGDSLKTLFGYTNEQAKAEHFWEERVHPEDKETAYEILRAHLKDKSKTKCEHEYRFLKADGEYAYVNDIGYILRDEKGNATRMIGAVTDVTKRKNLERHQELMSIISKSMNGSEPVADVLSQIAKLISNYTEVSVVEFWTASIDKRKLNRIGSGIGDEAGKKFEKQTKEIFGFSKGEGIPGQTWIRKKAMDEFKLTHADFIRSKAALKVGLDVGISLPIPLEDEIIGIILLLGKSKHIRISEHRPILESIAKEMAPYLQRKMTEEELNRFFDLSPDVLCIAGMDGFYKKVNPAMCNMLGLSRDEVLSKPIVDFVHPDDIEATTKELGSLSQGETTWKFENRYQTKSGQYIWFSWKAIPVFEEGLIYAVARNVTENKELEELLE